MKTRIKGLLILCTVLCMGFILSACGGVSNTENATAKKTVLNESIDIKDIDYDVDTRVIKGRKCLSFNYTNNSKYTINKVQLKLIQKDDADLKKTKEIFSDYISFADFSRSYFRCKFSSCFRLDTLDWAHFTILFACARAICTSLSSYSPVPRQCCKLLTVLFALVRTAAAVRDFVARISCEEICFAL